ncbi:MAG: phage tail tube protein [Bacillota bacterium]
MASKGLAAGGTILSAKYIEEGSGASSGYSDIAEIVDITGPGLSSDTSDITNHDSFTTENGWEEHVATVLRSGEVTFDLNYVPSNTTQNNSSGSTTVGSGEAPGLLYMLNNRTKNGFQITFTDLSNTQWQFDAFVTGFEPSNPHDDKSSASVTLKITGQPTLN